MLLAANAFEFSETKDNLRVWSLWRIMQELDLGAFAIAFAFLLNAVAVLKRPDGSAPNDPQLSTQELNTLLFSLDVLTSACQEVNLPDSLKHIDFLKKHLDDSQVFGRRTHSMVRTRIRVLQEVIVAELENRKFLWVDPEHSAIVDNDRAFGMAVWDKFPSARIDIREAGNCIAAECPTAAVFHLMRVLEHGLRALAGQVGKSFDIQQWHNIIEEIESEVKRLAKTLPRGLAKNDRLQFLSEAAKEFAYFKDGWRNYVSHSRRSYDAHAALSVFDHAKTFMAHLATKLSE